MNPESQNVNQTSQENDPPPHFEWKNFRRSVGVFVIDLLLLLLTSILVFLFVRHLVLGERIDVGLFSGDDWSKIVGHIAWPLSITLIVFLFRNPLLLLLYEMQGLIKRSYYRQGNDKDEMTNPRMGSEPIGEIRNEAEINDPSSRNERNAEVKILSLMERQFGTHLLHERCIRDSMYYFDAIAKVNDTIFGIEIKTTCNARIWKMVFERVEKIYKGFDRELQRRFVFVACIAGNNPIKERQSLQDLAQQQDFRVVLRFYEIEGKTVKEVL